MGYCRRRRSSCCYACSQHQHGCRTRHKWGIAGTSGPAFGIPQQHASLLPRLPSPAASQPSCKPSLNCSSPCCTGLIVLPLVDACNACPCLWVGLLHLHHLQQAHRCCWHSVWHRLHSPYALYLLHAHLQRLPIWSRDEHGALAWTRHGPPGGRCPAHGSSLRRLRGRLLLLHCPDRCHRAPSTDSTNWGQRASQGHHGEP